MMTALDETDSPRMRQPTRQCEKRDSSSSDGYSPDEKKEPNFEYPRTVQSESISWFGQNTRQNETECGVVRGTQSFSPNRVSDDSGFASSPGGSPSEDISSAQQDLDSITSVGSANGIHHRHPHQLHNQGAPNSQLTLSPDRAAPRFSPGRRRRTRQIKAKGFWDTYFRKRKWTAKQFFRTVLLAGVGLYCFVMIRGTQILMEHPAMKDEITEQPRNPFSDILSPIYHHHMGHLRLGSPHQPPLVEFPFVHKSTEDPVAVRKAVEERISERRKRTRPPIRESTASIPSYEIVSVERATEARRLRGDAEQSSFARANADQLCGEQARQLQEQMPQSFLASDSLIGSNARVLITGIVSNPLAFHLALTLKSKCGVEVLIGIDPMIPNTIRNRLEFVEQMKILASNAPKLVQPIIVPLMGLDPRVKKSKKESQQYPLMLPVTGELDLMNFKPTHIVHLSSATPIKPHKSASAGKMLFPPKQPLSPYQTSQDDPYSPSLLQLRSSMASMEQILASIVGSINEGASHPHLTYASASWDENSVFSDDEIVHIYSKLADEALANAYHSMFGTSSVGVRFPPNAVYGPWNSRDADMYKVFEAAIQGNSTTHSNFNTVRDLIYVQDAVQSILAAMQYRTDSAAKLQVKANSAASLAEVASTAHSLLSTTAAAKPSLAPNQMLLKNPRSLQQLELTSQTPLSHGILRTFAWHLDRARPFGPPVRAIKQISPHSSAALTGDALLERNSAETCAAHDLTCHTGSTYLPCSSECSTKSQCEASIFDPVRELTQNMTEGCDAVLYTQSLNPKTKDLQLQSQFEDDMEPAICNLAFVSQSSPLVNSVIDKIPKDQLQTLLGGQRTDIYSEKLSKLNGRLLYRGWILIWVDSKDPISTADSALLKLSPGRMFSGDVFYAVFVEENFTVSPTTDDVRFLISQMDRGETSQRSVYRMLKNEDHPKGTKVKLTLPAEPEKRASVLLSQLKFKISEKGRIPQDTKISIMDAVRFMRFELGVDPTKQKESSAIKAQKDFYRRIPTFVNGKDLRDNVEPFYKYDLKHWIRTRWVVHDLTLEESRGLRCEWYQEHVQWGSELDQLSFAAVMAKRVIERRMELFEPDDRSKNKPGLIPELRDVTDTSEWFAMATEQNKLQVLQDDFAGAVEHVKDDLHKDEAEDEATEDEPEVSAAQNKFSPEKKPRSGLYVRIISDRIMSLSRKAWARYKAEMQAQASDQANP